MKAKNKQRKIEHERYLKTLQRDKPTHAEPRHISLFDDIYGKQTANNRNVIAGMWQFTKLMD